jgi:hypothetical protein
MNLGIDRRGAADAVGVDVAKITVMAMSANVLVSID